MIIQRAITAMIRIITFISVRAVTGASSIETKIEACIIVEKGFVSTIGVTFGAVSKVFTFHAGFIASGAPIFNLVDGCVG